MLNALESRQGVAHVRLPAGQGFEDRCDAGTRGAQVWPLRNDWQAIVAAALELRPLVVCAGDGLCRMSARPSIAAGDAAGAGLAVDASRWACGMAVQERLDDGRLRRGLVFYDGVGRIVMRADLDADASPDGFHAGFHALIRRFSAKTPTLVPTDPRFGRAVPGGADADPVTRREALTIALGIDAVLEVLRHARQAGIVMAAMLECRGVRLRWDGALQELSARHGCAVVTGHHMELQWSETAAGLEARVLRYPTSAGLVQTLALQSPAGDTRLLLRPASSASSASSASPAAAGWARPQPCAWRAAIEAAQGGRCGHAC